jgi:tetratricopeptide (TPR) repeat protein
MKIEPQNAEAMVGLGYARYRTDAYGWGTAAENSYAAQLELLTKATAINPGYAFAHYVKSLVFWLAKQYPEAIEAAQTAVTLDPNAAYGYAAIGQAEFKLGRCEQSIEHIKKAFGLSPRDPLGGAWHMMLGLDEECLDRRDAAIMEFKRAIDGGYRPFIPYAAGLEAAKGNDAEAKLALAEARRLNPQLTIKWFLENPPAPSGVIEGLRKAGLREE